MNGSVRRGIDCQGLDAAVEADERLASEAILKARLLQDQQHPDEAAREYALAAGVELRLAEAYRTSHGFIASERCGRRPWPATSTMPLRWAKRVSPGPMCRPRCDSDCGSTWSCSASAGLSGRRT